MNYLNLILNLSLLVALSIVSGFIEKYWERNTRLGRLFQGALFGGTAVLGMLRPLNLGPGLIFDGRSIMVSLCAFFFGPWAAGVAIIMAIACRIWLEGEGMITGVMALLTTTGIGLLAHYRFNPDVVIPSARRLYFFGLVVHLIMLATMFTLPEGLGLFVVKRIGLPVLLLYPLATVLAGKILSDQIEAKRTIAAMQTSEKRLNTAQHLAKLDDFTWDVETGEVTWSDALFDLLKYDKSEKIDYAKINKDIHHPDDLERVTKWLNDCIASGMKDLTPNDYRLIRKDGEVIYVHTLGVIEREKGKYPKVFASVQDITERKLTEDALKESGKMFRIAFNQAPIGMCLVNPDGRFLNVNDLFCHMLGYSKSELLLKTFRDITHPDDSEDSNEWVRELLAGETTTIDFEKRYLHKAGYIVWGKVRAFLLRNIEGSPHFFITHVQDITEHKQAEKALRDSEERYHSIVDNIGIGEALISPKMEILELNHQMRAWFPDIDLSKHPICYRAFNNPPRDKICDYCPTCWTLQDGKVHENYTITPMADGPRNFRIVSSPIFDEQGKVTSAIEMVEDITERLTLERQLRQAQKLEPIGQLAGGIAHDFNNILSSIIGYTELALDDTKKGSLLADNLQEVYTAGNRAKDLVKQILAFARQSNEEIKPVKVDTIVKESLKLIRSTIPTSIEIKQNIKSNSLIMGNSTQIHQVLMNLCTNAAQAMEDSGGILEVGLADIEFNVKSPIAQLGLKPGKYVKVTISDTGPGIAPDIIGHIFDPYFTTKDVGKGTGLGLAMVHGIIQNYGGKIIVDSELDRGTVFSIYLPKTKEHGDYQSYEEDELPSGYERILFIDDELAIVKMNGQILERLGYQVTVRTSSVEALELFRSKSDDFDLVITDMTMPNMNGDELAMELIALRSDIPVILCTGYSRKVTDEKAAELGIKAFAYKPIVKADLAKTVRKVLDEAKGSAQV